MDFKRDGQDFIITFVPIKLFMKFPTNLEPGQEKDDEKQQQHVMTLCFIYRKKAFLEGIQLENLGSFDSIVLILVLIVLIILTLGIISTLAAKMSNRVFGPLSRLNSRMMNERFHGGIMKDMPQEDKSSREITDLYDTFKLLIQTKKFEKNDFMSKADAIAVIDLAEACNEFEMAEENDENLKKGQPPEVMNYKSSGICYNNIGSLKYK